MDMEKMFKGADKQLWKMIEKQFNEDLLYNRIVHYYIDKKNYSKGTANEIAQSVVIREKLRRTCKNPDCNHLLNAHIRNSSTCLKLECMCSHFVK